MGGRLYNQLVEDGRECILLDGSVVKQLFEIMCVETRDLIEPKLIYRIGYEGVAAWYTQTLSTDLPTKSSIE